MNPEMQKKLQEEREAMNPELRQAIALERIADLLQAINTQAVSITHHLARIAAK